MKRSLHSSILAAAFVCCTLPAAAHASPAPAAVPSDVLSAGTDRPGGVWSGVPVRPELRAPEAAWSLRTGLRKGILEATLDEERFAAPDAAILRSGAFAEWTGLLYDFREPFVLVGPADLAGLVRTKPVLIVPSGGLAGTAASGFFRAGLAEYVRNGGVLLCFTQRSAADYGALPVPDGEKLAAAGWTDDAGPLFRASKGQAIHPILAATRSQVPSLETDGYISAAPAGATVLLARPDGLPTLVLYPYGGGWVAVASLFSDVLSGQGLLHDDERTLVRSLLLWAKAGGRMTHSIPGGQFSLQFTASAPERKPAASLRATLIGPSRQRPLDVRTIPVDVKPGMRSTVPYAHATLSETPPGIYHLEYVFLDADGRQMAPAAESSDGWVLLSSNAAAGAAIPRQQPLARSDARFSVVPSIEKTGDRYRVRLEIERTSGPAGSYELLARVPGAVAPVALIRDRGTAVLDLPALPQDRAVSWSLGHASGGAIARGALPVAAATRPGVTADRPAYLPGQKIGLSVTGLGLGAITLSGLGTMLNQHLSGDRTLDLAVPSSLPTGTYPLAWEFQTRAGKRTDGALSIVVTGTRVSCTDASVMPQAQRDGTGVTAVLKLTASQAVKAVLRVWPVGPDGSELAGKEQPLSLNPGAQDAALSLPFKPERAGIWQFRYTITTTLPEGDGFSREPVLLAAGQVLHDAGDAAVTGIWTDRPMYYDPAGPVSVSFSVAARGATRVQLFLDGKRLRKETIERPDPVVLTIPQGDLAPGQHLLKATAETDGLESGRELRFLYGARLPDLVPTVRTSEPTMPIMEIGVAVMNRGMAASGPAEASLFAGDPDAGGALIQTAAIPPLEPGKQHVVVVPWPLAGKAGKHTLFVVADRNSRVLESVEDNNIASVSFQVPSVLLGLAPDKAAYRTDEAARYRITVVNFTASALANTSLIIQASDPAGANLPAETVSLASLVSGASATIDRTLDLKVPQEGMYLISVRAVSPEGTVASDSLGITILPTLQLAGSLEGTPPVAAACRPFAIRYQVRNAGNIPPTNGSLKLEIRSADQKQLFYAQQLPFSLATGTNRIDRLEVPRGSYRLTARASAVNQERGMNADFLLADQQLTVAPPVDVKRSSAPFPRILVWTEGDTVTTIERAVAEKLLKEAFSTESVRLKTVSRPEDFTSEALTGQYNVYVLFEVEPAPDTAEILRSGLAKGRGAVLIGSRGRTQSLAEALDFQFGDPLPGSGTSITFPADSGLGITGSVPVAGRFLPAHKKGARTAATLPDGRAAVLVDARETGRVIVLPFPLVQSAQAMGTTDLYSLLLRSTVLTAAPEREEPGGIASEQLLVSSLSGTTERTRVVGTLPQGAQVLWTNVPAVQKGGTVSFELTAGDEPRKVLYLFRPAASARTTVPTELFTECEGRFVSQGKVE